MLDVNDGLLDAIRSSPCPYALRGRYVLGARWDGPFPAVRHLDRLAKTLAEEAVKSKQERADAIVAASLHDSTGMTYQHLCQALLISLVGLHARDPLARRDLVADLPESLESWDFTYRGVAYFVPAFSSIYDHDHPRRSDVPNMTYFLFQPEYAFRRFNISSGRPHRRILSEQVHDRFVAGGRAYPIETTTDWPKIYRFIKPAKYDDGPIAWWLVEPE